MKRFTVLTVLVVAVSALMLSGCFTLDVADLIGDLDGSRGEAQRIDEQPSGGSQGQAVPTQPSPDRPSVTYGGLGAAQATMMFSQAYFQIFFIGGYGRFDDFRESEGVKWEMVSSGGDTITLERALLRRTGRGEWWYLSMSVDRDTFEFEVFLDSDYAPIEMIWRDPGSGEIMRHTFERGEAPDPRDYGESGYTAYSDGSWGRAVPSRESVRVPAGRYDAGHIVHEMNDPSSGARVEFNWWIVDDVPGDLVKFDYLASNGERFTGELIETRMGYRTRFGAY
jgi:hypothetical protein